MKEQLKPYKTVQQIAKKHRLEVSFIQKQLDMGAPIEHEHTKNQKLAVEIALQHLDEIPDYYTRLKKMEADAKKEHKKYKDVTEQKSEIRYCGLCRKDESKEDCKYGPDMWDKYTKPQEMLGQNQIKYNPNRPHPANEEYNSTTIEDANGNTFVQIIDIIRPDRLVKEGKKMKSKDPCWKGYEMVGKKEKNGKEVPNCVPKEEKSFESFMSEASPAWQRKAGKNPEGGLNKKGISSYRKEHPGSHLSLAVTTEPSKLKKGSKKANRRKSFCARSAGQMEMWPKAAKDPNSRLRLARKKWNC